MVNPGQRDTRDVFFRLVACDCSLQQLLHAVRSEIAAHEGPSSPTLGMHQLATSGDWPVQIYVSLRPAAVINTAAAGKERARWEK